jgi:hypothetical protein
LVRRAYLCAPAIPLNLVPSAILISVANLKPDDRTHVQVLDPSLTASRSSATDSLPRPVSTISIVVGEIPLYQDKAVTPTSLKDIFTPIWSEPSGVGIAVMAQIS